MAPDEVVEGDTAVTTTGTKPWVTMQHPDIVAEHAELGHDIPETATHGYATREAFVQVWEPVGWIEIAEHDSPPSPTGAAQAEVHDDGTEVDPQRLNKVLAGEVAPEDVGVDPRAGDGQVMWAPDAETPAPSSPAEVPASDPVVQVDPNAPADATGGTVTTAAPAVDPLTQQGA